MLATLRQVIGDTLQPCSRGRVAIINASSPHRSIWNVVAPTSVGVLQLAQVLRERGHRVGIFDNRSLSGVFRESRLARIAAADYVCFSFFTSGSEAAYRLSEELRDLSRRRGKAPAPQIMGGIHPSVRPQEAMEHADYVIVGEGLSALPALLSYLEIGTPALRTIGGLCYCDANGAIQHNAPAPITDKGLLQTPAAYHLSPGRFRWNRIPVLTPDLGCPFKCTFCSQPFGAKKRLTDPHWVVGEIERIADHTYHCPNRVVFIGSDNFAFDKKWAKQVLRLALARGLESRIRLHV